MRGLAFSNMLHIRFFQFRNLPKKIMIFIEVRWNLNVRPTLKTYIYEKTLTHFLLFFPRVSVSFPSLFSPALFSPVTKEIFFFFFYQWISCIAEMEAQTVFSLISKHRKSQPHLSVSWGMVLFLPNGSNSSQTLGLGIHYRFLEVWGSCGLTFKYCLLFSFYSTKFCMNN